MRLLLCLLFLFSLVSARELDLKQSLAAGKPGASAGKIKFCKIPNGNDGLLLQAKFGEDSIRATWDFPLAANLSKDAAIRIKLLAQNIDCVRQADLHLRLNATWYTATFEVHTPGQWEEITIPRLAFSPEGVTASWAQCNTLRISLWCGSKGTPSLKIASIETIPPNANATILCGGGSQADYKSARRYPAMLADAFSQNGLLLSLTTPEDSSEFKLNQFKMVLIPDAEKLTSAQKDTVVKFIEKGGKVALFHSPPDQIARALKLPSGKFKRASDISSGLASVAPSSLLPGIQEFQQGSQCFMAVTPVPSNCRTAAWWLGADHKNTGWPAILEFSNGFWMTHVFLNQDTFPGAQMLIAMMDRKLPGTTAAAAKELVRRNEFHWNSAPDFIRRSTEQQKLRSKEQLESGNYTEASRIAWKLHGQLKSPVAPQKPARTNEIRALYCKYPDGLPGLHWQGTISKSAQAGFNIIIPYAGAPYESAVPVKGVSALPKNELQSCVREAKARKIRAVAWFNCLGLGDAPKSAIDRFKQENRLIVNSKNQTASWLCPNNPSNRALIKTIVAETIRQIQFDGILFDRIRYPSGNGCYCTHCRSQFEKRIGHQVKSWPAQILENGSLRTEWNNFRIASITSLLAELINTVHRTRPSCLVAAAVYPDWDSARSSVAQDWVAWCRNKWLSFVTPMNYHASASQFASDVKRQASQTKSPERLVPAIGLSVNRLSQNDVNAQIFVSRQENTAGFSIFDLIPGNFPQIP